VKSVKAEGVSGCETWIFGKRNELLLKRFEMDILRRIFGPVKDPNTDQYCITRTNAELHDLGPMAEIVKSIKSQCRDWLDTSKEHLTTKPTNGYSATKERGVLVTWVDILFY